jgi:biotin operon repressor
VVIVLFEQRLRDGLHDGSITVAFRRWRRVQVVAGHHYRTGRDMVAVDAIDVLQPADISTQDARAAGYSDIADLIADLRGDPALPLYRIRFKLLAGPDPRDALAADADLTDADIAAMGKRLARMDAASKHGPWTGPFLALIGERPAVSSALLAESLGWDRPEFKLHVRRLKAAGLTISLDVGYRLSARGRAYLAASEITGEMIEGSSQDGPPRP